MNLATALFQALASGLSIWETAQARKYQRKFEKAWDEYDRLLNQPDDSFDDAALYNAERELMQLCQIFSAEISSSTTGKQNPKN